MAGERHWSLESARRMLPDVRKRTQRVVEECEAMTRRRETLAQGSPERKSVERRIRRVVERWAREMEALGVEAKGTWMVDFDNGSGYYCWKWPEERLDYYHGYDEGFAGRTRIQ